MGVFSVTAPAYDAREQTSDLWLVPVDGSAAPRQLTQTKPGESGAAWNPDSRRIAFSSKREGDEAAQLHVLDLAGGEAERVASLTLGARQSKWSPDGSRLLFVSDVFPGCADEWAPGGQSVVFTAAVNRDATARTPVRTQIFAVAAAGGEPRNLTNDQRSYTRPQFAPDGRTLLCATSENRWILNGENSRF